MLPVAKIAEDYGLLAFGSADGWDISVVMNEENIVLGTLGRNALRSKRQTSVEDAMTAGPSTIRPSARLDDIAIRMRDQNLTRVIVTRSDGLLLGVVRAEDIEPPHIGL